MLVLRIRSASVAGVLGSFVLAAGLLHCVGDEPSQLPTDTPGVDGSVDGGGGGGGEGGPTSDANDGSASPPLLTDAVSIAAGRSHTCAINAAQEVLCWGSNGAGQLGVPVAQTARTSTPVKVDIGGKAVAIAAGGAHTCAILTDGTIKCWGNNERGQLGRGTLVPTGSVALVSPPTANVALWKAAEIITAGAAFTCAAVNQGNVNGLPDRRFFCWGENINRQSGTESTNGQPVTVPSLITAAGDDKLTPSFEGFAIAAGDDFACAGIYAAAGAALFSIPGCWGSRAVGQIGAPPVTGGFEVNPEKYPSKNADGSAAPLAGVFKVGLVAAGSAHGCVRFEQAGVTPPVIDCWGNNTKGQTGGPQSGARPVEAIAGFDATDVTALAAGGQTTCVITNGQVQCIGLNDSGQLGRGAVDTASNAAFASVKLAPSASTIAVGANHACAVLGGAAGQKGPVACWGQNTTGQLGDGLDVDVGYAGEPDPLKYVRATPVMVLAPK